MGSQLAKLEHNVISPFAFHAPAQPTYTRKEQHLTPIHTINRDRILTSFKAHTGDAKRYWEPGRYAQDDEHPFIIFSHGNAYDIGGCQEYMQWLATSFNANVITYDYVNYGHSERGQTTQKNMEDAIMAVYEHVNKDIGVPQERIVLMGKSLGTAPTVFLAARDFMDDIFGVVLVSPLASGARAVAPPKFVKSKMLHYLDTIFCPSINLVPFVRTPVFIVHGKQDDVIPIENAELLVAQLHSKAYYPPLYLHGKHNDLERGNPVLLRDQLTAFFKSCQARRAAEQDTRVLYEAGL